MLRSNFLQDKHNRKGMPAGEKNIHEQEDIAVNNVTHQMKQMFNHQRF